MYTVSSVLIRMFKYQTFEHFSLEYSGVMFTLACHSWSRGVAGPVLTSLVVTVTAMQTMAGSFLLTARVRLDILSGRAQILLCALHIISVYSTIK